MVNRSILGFTNRTKHQSSTAFGNDASARNTPGRTKPLSAEEKQKKFIAHLDATARPIISKEAYDKLDGLLAATRLKKRKPKQAKKSPSKKGEAMNEKDSNASQFFSKK